MAKPLNSVYLIRHAHAGQRGSEKRDLYRGLSKRGLAEAQGLTKQLKKVEIATVLSSPATRCVQTVERLAEAQGLEVVESEDLFEDARALDALSLMEEFAKGSLAVCSHGNLIPEIIEMLVDRHGIKVKGRGCEKGSVWELQRKPKGGNKWVSATYAGVFSS